MGKGFFAEVGWSKKCCKTKSRWSYWDGKWILIENKKLPLSTG